MRPEPIRYLALLRAVNVGGAAPLSMEALRRALSAAGFGEVETVLQTGNVLFTAPDSEEGRLEEKLTVLLREKLSLETNVFVRSAPEWARAVSANPFPHEAETDPSHLTLTALKRAPPAAAWGELRRAISGPERVGGHGRHAYIIYPEGIGRSRVTPALIERKLGSPGTARNWNTVLRLAQRLAP